MIKFAEFKKFFLYTLIGSLIISAIVAVVVVLIGTFNEITNRVFFTLAMVVIHSLVSLLFIWDDERQNTFERLAFFVNVFFGIVAISFLTSILGIWKVISGESVLHLYQTYAVIVFASLHGDILSKVLNKKNYLDMIIYINYIFMVVVFLLIQPIIYVPDPSKTLGEFYYRILGAAGIIDGTLSILTIILYRLYINNHPKTQDMLSTQIYPPANVQNSTVPAAVQKKGLSIWVWILIIYLASQVLIPLISFGAFSLFR